MFIRHSCCYVAIDVVDVVVVLVVVVVVVLVVVVNKGSIMKSHLLIGVDMTMFDQHLQNWLCYSIFILRGDSLSGSWWSLSHVTSNFFTAQY